MNDLVKSRKRVADHGEVFTPSWMVEAMLNSVKTESERVDSRFLEPACGSGNFLVEVLKRKLVTVERTYGKSSFERTHHALLSLMCIYGIELLEDNAVECRGKLLAVFSGYLGVANDSEAYKAAENVLRLNIIQGDALEMKTPKGASIVFPEWGYLMKGMFSRRDFSYDSLTQRSSYEGTLFDLLAEHQIFVPVMEHPRLSINDLAALALAHVDTSRGSEN